MADAKEETPNGRKRDGERKRGTKVPRTERRNNSERMPGEENEDGIISISPEGFVLV